MRRSEEEFKAELFRRCGEYKKAQKKRRRIITSTCTLSALCIFMLSAALIFTQPNDIQLLDMDKGTADTDTVPSGNNQEKYLSGTAGCASE